MSRFATSLALLTVLAVAPAAQTPTSVLTRWVLTPTADASRLWPRVPARLELATDPEGIRIVQWFAGTQKDSGAPVLAPVPELVPFGRSSLLTDRRADWHDGVLKVRSISTRATTTYSLQPNDTLLVEHTDQATPDANGRLFYIRER